jgi:hypothetical protein
MPNAADVIAATELAPTFNLPSTFVKALRAAPTKYDAALVGLSIAAATGAIASLLGDHAGKGIETACALSTAAYGWIWWRSLINNRNTWMRVLVSILLAAGNAATAFYIYSVVLNSKSGSPDPIIWIAGALIIGVSLGAIIWIPALVTTVAIFGYAIAEHAKAKLGSRDDVDYANQVTATTCFVLATAAVVMLTLRWGRGWDIVTPLMFGLAAMCAGLGRAFGATNCMRTRRLFVLAVLEGKHPELIYQASDEGDFILRRTVEGTAYRQTEVATVLVRV